MSMLALVAAAWLAMALAARPVVAVRLALAEGALAGAGLAVSERWLAAALAAGLALAALAVAGVGLAVALAARSISAARRLASTFRSASRRAASSASLFALAAAAA